jgi:hypothetical protein
MEQNTKKILIATGIIGVLSIIAYKLLANKRATSTQGLGMPTTTETLDPNVVPPPIEDISIYSDKEVADMKAAEEKAASSIKYTSEELADLLYQDFSGSGTNWAAGPHGGVVGVLLQLNTDEDFDNLNAAYGIRPIKAGLFKSIFEKPYVGDMNGAFNSELSKREFAMVNEILSKKGITRRIVVETKY